MPPLIRGLMRKKITLWVDRWAKIWQKKTCEIIFWILISSQKESKFLLSENGKKKICEIKMIDSYHFTRFWPGFIKFFWPILLVEVKKNSWKIEFHEIFSGNFFSVQILIIHFWLWVYTVNYLCWRLCDVEKILKNIAVLMN